MGMLTGKKALIFGLANDKSIAYGILEALHREGAEIALSYAGPVLEKRVKPIAERFNIKFCEECDLTDDIAVSKLFDKLGKDFGNIDILVHSVAFAPKEALQGRYVDTTRQDFLTTMNISVFTFIDVVKRAEALMPNGGSAITMTYYGGEKVIPNYNVMGVAKSALDSSVRYLASDLGPKNIRVNAISAGPIKTLAASGVGSFKDLLASFAQSAPLRRTVTIEECGKTALYLASDLSSGVTGEIIHVDAGFSTLGMPAD